MNNEAPKRSNHFDNAAIDKGTFPDHISSDGTAYYRDGTVLHPVDPPAAPTEQCYWCRHPDHGEKVCSVPYLTRGEHGLAGSYPCGCSHSTVVPAAPADERDKALAATISLRFRHSLSREDQTEIEKEIITALATVRAEVWRDAMKIIDDAGEEWGVQARDRKSKTYSAYVIAALDLKGRFDESTRTGKVEE